MKRAIIAIIVIIALIALPIISAYNQLVSLREAVDLNWSQIETQMQRRADLIPNLVNTVKGYASHEKEIFEYVADARAKLAGAKTRADQIAANRQLDIALSRLLAIAESYPQLKADQTFLRLMDELAGTENRIAVARIRYNEAVKRYNVAIKRFPTNIIARMFGFEEQPYFKAEEGKKAVPKVNFNGSNKS